MKLAFTTLGCLEWTFDEIIKNAVDYGFTGVDFRGYQGELDLWKIPDFRAEAMVIRQRFTDAGLAIPCLGSSVSMFSAVEKREPFLEEIKHYVEIASNIGAKYVRVFGGRLNGASYDEAMPVAANFLNQASDLVKGSGVEVLIETHDDWVDTQVLMQAFEAAQMPENIGILWDTHHPYRGFGEVPAETWSRIGGLTKYTHWKDSALAEPDADGKRALQHKLIGEGDIPLAEIYAVLKDGGYDGWYTLEWERKWHPEIEPATIAFPKYVEVMRKIDAEYQASKH